jgi:hypothetical protein
VIYINLFSKQPNELFEFSCDFSNNLSSGETINGYTVTASHLGEDATSTVIDSNRKDDDNVYVKVKAGTDGYDYKITVEATTSTGNVFETEVTMKVRDE